MVASQAQIHIARSGQERRAEAPVVGEHGDSMGKEGLWSQGRDSALRGSLMASWSLGCVITAIKIISILFVGPKQNLEHLHNI